MAWERARMNSSMMKMGKLGKHFIFHQWAQTNNNTTEKNKNETNNPNKDFMLVEMALFELLVCVCVPVRVNAQCLGYSIFL